jgi:hypothetical protein
MDNSKTLVIIKTEDIHGYTNEYHVTDTAHSDFLNLIDYTGLVIMRAETAPGCICSRERWYDYMYLITRLQPVYITGSMVAMVQR